MWLVFKSYNELLLRYPNIKNKDLHKIDDSCFQTVLSYSKIEEIIKITQEQITANKDDIPQYVCTNKQDMQNIITRLAGVDSANIVNIAEDSYHKHRHHHGEVHNRGRRDIDKVDFSREDDSQDLYAASGAASNKPMLAAYNVVKWIGGGIGTILHYLNPVEQIKHCFNKDKSRIDEKIIDITNNSEQSNKAFIGNVVNYDLLDMQGNLLLLDLFIRKKNGVKYNNNGVVIKNNIDNEYAQSLAYSAYILKDQLPSSISYIENNTEYMGLLG